MSSEIANTTEKSPEIRKKVFVIKAKQNGLKSAENFLKNRTWEIISASDMKIALATLFRHKIDYAMIGVDHVHPHVLKLPEIIAQTIKIPVILFAENMTPQAAHVLRTVRHPYILFPPVSGPAIERMLLKIEKDRTQSAARPADARTMESGASDPSTIRISEGGGAFDHAQMNGSFSEEDIAKLFAGEGLSPMMNSNEAGQTGSLNSAMQNGNGMGIGMGAMQNGNGSGAPMSEVQPAAGSHIGANKTPSLRKGSTIDLSLWPQNNKPQSDSLEPSKNPTQDSFAPYVEDMGGYDRQIPHQSVLINGTEHALQKAANHGALEAPQTISPTTSSNVACFAVRSSGVWGAIVVAYGKDRIVDRKFANDLQDHLLIYMQENGIEFKIEDVMNLTIKQVKFEEWSEKEAVFLRKSIHEGCELALGFFINTGPNGELAPSVRNDMLKVNIDEIRADHSLDFDVYLYFPENGKYLRYVGKDGHLSGKQWDRLTAGGVTELHIRKESEADISRYRMKNFLNDKITDFNNKKAS